MNSIFSDMIAEQNKITKGANSTFSSVKTPNVKINEVLPASPDLNAMPDTFEPSRQQEHKEKKGPIKTIKTFIANVQKCAVSTTEYAKGLSKGVFTGGIAASLIYTGGQVVKHFKPNSKIPSKPLAIVAAAGAVLVNLWTASLNATQRRSDVDHRWIGHKNN